MPRRLGAVRANVFISGERVRELRVEAEMTQEEFGARIDRSKGYISQLENGNPARITQEVLERIAGAFEVSSRTFLYRTLLKMLNYPKP